MTLREAQTLTLRVLKQVMEEKLDHHNVQLAQVRHSSSICIVVRNRFLMMNACLTGHTADRLRDTRREEVEGGHRNYVMRLYSNTYIIHFGLDCNNV